MVQDPWSAPCRRRTGQRDQPAYVRVDPSNPYIIGNSAAVPQLPGVSSQRGTRPNEQEAINDMIREGKEPVGPGFPTDMPCGDKDEMNDMIREGREPVGPGFPTDMSNKDEDGGAPRAGGGGAGYITVRSWLPDRPTTGG